MKKHLQCMSHQILLTMTFVMMARSTLNTQPYAKRSNICFRNGIGVHVGSVGSQATTSYGVRKLRMPCISRTGKWKGGSRRKQHIPHPVARTSHISVKRKLQHLLLYYLYYIRQRIIYSRSDGQKLPDYSPAEKPFVYSTLLKITNIYEI